jgi:hypothetical protein
MGAEPGYEVGYKRTPVHRRFGNRPPPRGKRSQSHSDNSLWVILQEPRRILVNGKPEWVSTLELLVRRAFELSECGSSTLNCLLAQMSTREPAPKGEVTTTLFDKSAPPFTGVIERLFYADGRIEYKYIGGAYSDPEALAAALVQVEEWTRAEEETRKSR